MPIALRARFALPAFILLAGCGDQGITDPHANPTTIPPAVRVAVKVAATEDWYRGMATRLDLRDGDARFFEWQHLYRDRCSPRECHELAVVIGSDTAWTDSTGTAVFPGSVSGVAQIAAFRPEMKGQYGQVVPSTFWHAVEFGSVEVRAAPEDTTDVVLPAMAHGYAVYRAFLGDHGSPPAERQPWPGVTVRLFASDSITQLDAIVTDERGEAVFRPVPLDSAQVVTGTDFAPHPAPWLMTTDGGYDGTRFECVGGFHAATVVSSYCSQRPVVVAGELSGSSG